VFKQKWSAEAIREAGERLQWLVKNTFGPPPGAHIAPFCGQQPEIYKTNMAWRLAKRRVTKFGSGNVADIPPATPLAWVLRGDPRFNVEAGSGNSEGEPVASKAIQAVVASSIEIKRRALNGSQRLIYSPPVPRFRPVVQRTAVSSVGQGLVPQVDLVCGTVDATLPPSIFAGERPSQAPKIQMRDTPHGEAPPQLVVSGDEEDVIAMDEED
jgi:hypothetical protein